MVLPVEWIPCCGRVCCEKITYLRYLTIFVYLGQKLCCNFTWLPRGGDMDGGSAPMNEKTPIFGHQNAP